jgi:YVTN family beta-propeller protein
MIPRHRPLMASFLRRAAISPALVFSFATAGLVQAGGVTDDAKAAWGRLITSAAIVCNQTTHKVYAVNEGAGSVTVIDAATGDTRTLSVGGEPIAIAVNQRTNRIYVANDGSASVSVIDGASDKVIATIPVSRLPYMLAVDDTANKVYITHTYAGVVTVVDGAKNTAEELKVGDADGVVTDPRTGSVFLVTYEDPNIRILDGATGAVTRVAIGPHTWGMALDEATSILYFAHTAAGEIVALDEKTHATRTIAVGKIPCAVAINQTMHRIYVVNYGDATVSVIDLQARQVIATLRVGKHPQGVAVDSRRNQIYIADVLGDTVTLIDGEKNAVIGVLRAGKNPYAVAVDEASGRAYAANYNAPWFTPVSLAH